MSKFKLSISYAAAIAVLGLCSPAQERQTSAKPTEHVLGTVSAVNSAAQSITVKDDKTATEYSVSLVNTHTLLKVAPGAKDLKSATRISANELVTGDRVDVRGLKSDGGSNSIAAKSLVLMSARDLQQKQQTDTASWQQSTVGTVTSVNAATSAISINVKTLEGLKPVAVQAPASAEFTRYSPENPKTPAGSKITDIQSGDQLRVIGQKSEDGSTITAAKIYTGAFRTIAGTITSLGPDGGLIRIRDLQTKQVTEIMLTAESSIRKLPAEIAARLARRLNPRDGSNPVDPHRKSAEGAGTQSPNDASAHSEGPGAEPSPEVHRENGGDLSQILQRLPPMTVSDLKTGDAVVVSGAAGNNNKSQIIATTIIAGVEPIFQSAPSRQGRSLGGDWSLDMAVPAQ